MDKQVVAVARLCVDSGRVVKVAPGPLFGKDVGSVGFWTSEGANGGPGWLSKRKAPGRDRGFLAT